MALPTAKSGNPRCVVRRALITRGDSTEQIASTFKKLGNAFQNIERSKKELVSIFGYDPFDSAISERLKLAFEKRHPITHNLGVIDRKYMERAQAAEKEGREIRLTAIEITDTLSDVSKAITFAYNSLLLK